MMRTRTTPVAAVTRRPSIEADALQLMNERVAAEVMGMPLVAATVRRPMTASSCRVQYGTWINSKERSAWGNRVERVPDFGMDERLAMMAVDYLLARWRGVVRFMIWGEEHRWRAEFFIIETGKRIAEQEGGLREVVIASACLAAVRTYKGRPRRRGRG